MPCIGCIRARIIGVSDVFVEIVPQLDEWVVQVEVAQQLGAVVRDTPLADGALGQRLTDHVPVAAMPRPNLFQRRVVGKIEVAAEVERVSKLLSADGTPLERWA